MTPAFFDIFGFLGFIILFFIGLKIAKNKKLKNYGLVILVISSIGIIVDGIIVLMAYLLN